MKAGLNLFSIRHAIQTEADFLKTALKLKEMGYAYLQFSGAPFDAEMITRVSRESEMPVYLTHVPMERILADTDRLMEEHASFGCYNIGLGAMPSRVIADEALCKQTIADLNKVGERMQKNGFRFFYHHHNYEFYKHSGQTVFDYMIANAPYINFTADTYWLQYGGVDVAEMLGKLKGRIACVHLKDYGMACKQREDGGFNYEPVFAPVGDGTIDFKKVVQAALAGGTEYFFVEQDNAPDFDDPFGQVERSIRYIKKEL